MNTKEINTIDDLKIGTIFKCSWYGMSDFYELIGKTKQSVKLAKLEWETGAGPNGEPADDLLYRWCHIVRDADGKAVREKDYNGKDKIYMKRIINLKNGGITFKSPNYSGAAFVEITNNDYAYMYWG